MKYTELQHSEFLKNTRPNSQIKKIIFLYYKKNLLDNPLSGQEK